MSFWVYILRCVDNCYYTGQTDNLEKRIAEHQTGELRGYTSPRLPVVLLFSQEFPSREGALAAERQIKGWSRRKKEAFMQRRLGRGVSFSPPFDRPVLSLSKDSGQALREPQGPPGCIPTPNGEEEKSWVAVRGSGGIFPPYLTPRKEEKSCTG